MARIRYARRTGRVLLVDQENRLLLFRFVNREQKTEWLTPGGGANRLESPARTAARELFEETGLSVPPRALGPMVATTSGYADFGWTSGVMRDDFFFHRVASHVVDPSGQEEYEAAQIQEHRWWSTAELAETEDAVYPLGLVPLLDELTAGRLPSEPVELPWHH